MFSTLWSTNNKTVPVTCNLHYSSLIFEGGSSGNCSHGCCQKFKGVVILPQKQLKIAAICIKYQHKT